MKRYVSMFLLIVVGFLLQTCIFPHLKLTNIMPNVFVILTAVSGFMYGRKFGIITGFFCGGLLDVLYGRVIGINIFIYVLIGYWNGKANKLYFKDDLTIPLMAMAGSDLVFGFLYYICNFMMRGRLHIISYFVQVMVPEMIYTVAVGILVYRFMHWLEEKMYPETDTHAEKEKDAF